MIGNRNMGSTEVAVRKFGVYFVILFSSIFGSPLFAEEFASPDWSSNRILEHRTDSDDSAITMVFKSETTADKEPATVKSGMVRLWSDFDQISVGTLEIMTDYRLCRVFSWDHAQPAFNNQSCYADPAFRQSELRNRLQLNELLKKAGVPEEDDMTVDDPFWIEQEFAAQVKRGNPLKMVKSKDGVEWRLGNETVTKISNTDMGFSQSDRQRFARYFSRYVSIHPQVRRDILDSGKIPSRIEITRRALSGKSIEIITFESVQTAQAAYPLPPNLISNIVIRSREETIEAQGLRQSLKVLAGNAAPPKESFEALLKRLEDTAKRKESIQTTLAFLKLTQLYGPEFMSNPSQLDRVRRIMPIVQPIMESGEGAIFMQASNLSGEPGGEPEREAAALYLAEAENLDQMDFGTFRYVTYANLVRISEGVKKWDMEIFRKMPSVTDSYWKHIAAHPSASNTYSDLGSTRLEQFETYRAWEAWDLGRAVDPNWQGGVMKSIATFEKRVRASMPDNF